MFYLPTIIREWKIPNKWIPKLTSIYLLVFNWLITKQ